MIKLYKRLVLINVYLVNFCNEDVWNIIIVLRCKNDVNIIENIFYK